MHETGKVIARTSDHSLNLQVPPVGSHICGINSSKVIGKAGVVLALKSVPSTPVPVNLLSTIPGSGHGSVGDVAVQPSPTPQPAAKQKLEQQQKSP